jgi:hypothetical protein
MIVDFLHAEWSDSYVGQGRGVMRDEIIEKVIF